MFKVSIIIPVYNVSDYIVRCIESIINQTYLNIECLLIDDCSTDNSIELAEKRIQNYKGSIIFTIFKHEQNKGVSESRNTGIKNATGDYLYFLDSDDEITQDCIETMIGLCRNNEEMVIGDFNETGGILKHHIIFEEPLYSNKEIFKAYINQKWYEMPWNKLVRKDFILNNNLFFYSGMSNREDALWSFQVASKLESLSFTNKKTYIYYIRSNSLNATYNLKRANDTLDLLDEIVSCSLTSKYNISNYIINLAMGSLDEIYFQILTPLLKTELFYKFTKKVKTTIDRYPMLGLDGDAEKRLSLIKHPLLLSLYYQYKHHKIVAVVYHRIVFKFLFKNK